MKFDLDTAWKDATTLLRDNLRLLAVVAGVFYFIPYMAAMLWIPGLAEISAGGFQPNAPEIQAKVNAMFADYWWALVLLGIVQGMGLITLLALLRRRANPTVAEAIQIGATSVLSYLAASLLAGFLVGLAILLVVAVTAIIGVGVVQVLGAIVSIGITCYLFTKFSLSSAIIAIDGERNPLSALSGSWRLTKGHSLRLFFYYALLFIAYIVISMLISLVLSLLFALGGAETQTFGQAFSASLMNAVFVVIFASVLAAVHAQLRRLNAPPQQVDEQY